MLHSIYEHESWVCSATKEQHIHSVKSDCGFTHYLSQNLSNSIQNEYSIMFFDEIEHCESSFESISIIPLLCNDPDRGPPSIVLTC